MEKKLIISAILVSLFCFATQESYGFVNPQTSINGKPIFVRPVEAATTATQTSINGKPILTRPAEAATTATQTSIQGKPILVRPTETATTAVQTSINGKPILVRPTNSSNGGTGQVEVSEEEIYTTLPYTQ